MVGHAALPAQKLEFEAIELEPIESPEWAATRIQACWRGCVARDDYQAAKQAKAKKERRAKRKATATRIQACWRHYRSWILSSAYLKCALDFFEYEERVCGVNSELGRAKALVAASKNFDAVYAAAYAEQVEYAKLLLGHIRIRQSSVTRLQACWRGVLGRKYCKAAKQAKAKKERRAKRKAAATRIQARSVSEGSLAAALLNGSAGQLVVGSTILGHSIANDEPQYGGKCACVGLLTGDVPPCLGGSVTVFDDAPEAFYYAAWDYCERYIDQACDVRFFDLTGSEGIFTDITSFRQLLSVGDPFDLPGNADLQTFLAERREPLGYTNTGRRLIHSQDLVFMVVAAVFMQIDVVLLDAASACPLYMIVRCRLDPRRACAPSH